jgi:hypothetical protein
MAYESRSYVLAACRLILAPLVRLLLKSGIAWQEFSDLAKTVYVQVATREFGIRGRPTNISRVAIMTGINRREVARQREPALGAETPQPTYAGAATRLLTGWHSDADYRSAEGEPLPLPVRGPAPSFEDLCRRYGGTVPATALMKELRNVGAVAETNDGLLRALQRSYMPLPLDGQKTLIGGTLVGDLTETVVHDLTAAPGTPLRYARHATNARVHARHAEEFRQLLHREGQAFLERIDDWLTQHEIPADAPADEHSVRLGAGIYHIQDTRHRGAAE